MALDVHASFSAGELDPALHERTTLNKYQSGLATARNVYIGKSGRIITRAGRRHFIQTKLANRKVRIHPMGHSTFVEFGHEYLRIYSLSSFWTGGPVTADDYDMEELTHSITEDQLEDVQFVDDSETSCYIFCFGVAITYLNVNGPPLGGTSAFGAAAFGIPTGPTFVSNSAGGTGYDVDYAVSFVVAGQESEITLTATGKLPITTGTSNTIIFDLAGFGGASLPLVTEMKVYRRPRGGGSFGYVGSSSSIVTSGSAARGTYIDLGSAADYLNSPPTTNTSINVRGGGTIKGPTAFLPRAGLIYQQRLLSSSFTGIEASRTGFLANFYRDYPLSNDSSLTFKAGASGNAAVYFMVESDGLVVFTEKGVYINIGPLSPTNIALERKGKWVIDYRVPPLIVPGGLLFVDSTSNVIRRLLWSTEQAGYVGQEVSIFSDHLFIGKRIVSWTFQEGEAPFVVVALSDGTFATFTFEPDQEMRAWTRHDTQGANVEVVATLAAGRTLWWGDSDVTPARTIYVVEKDGDRFIEFSVPRFVSSDIAINDPESDKNESAAMMDSMITFRQLANETPWANPRLPNYVFTLTPVVADDWEGPLTLTSVDNVLVSPGIGAVGTIFRHFDINDGSAVDLEVTARASDGSITVQPSAEFPEDQAADPRLYVTRATFSDLDHLEGEEVSVMSDGYVIGSPNNDHENYPSMVVTGGEITLPGGLRGAIVHIGRPITADAGTLDIDSVEQRPVLIESKTVDKLYVKSYRSRGMYIGPRFPSNNKVKGDPDLGEIPMQDIDSIEVDYESPIEIVGNRYQAPVTKRSEVSLPGDWKSNGRVCIRQVDPVHFEILSIIPDIDDQRR